MASTLHTTPNGAALHQLLQKLTTLAEHFHPFIGNFTYLSTFFVLYYAIRGYFTYLARFLLKKYYLKNDSGMEPSVLPRTGRSFSLHPKLPQDESAIIKLAQAAGMGTLTHLDETTVAADKHTNPIGFIRLTMYGQIYYVNPVVVDPLWQGRGVGTALMLNALQNTNELRFVARGYSVGFYEHLGCECISWDLIAPEIASDCEECELAATCNPTPMRMRSQMSKVDD